MTYDDAQARHETAAHDALTPVEDPPELARLAAVALGRIEQTREPALQTVLTKLTHTPARSPDVASWLAPSGLC